jgi:hypothetical protein
MATEQLEVVFKYARLLHVTPPPPVRWNAQVLTKRVSKFVMLTTSTSYVAMYDTRCHDSKNLALGVRQSLQG